LLVELPKPSFQVILVIPVSQVEANFEGELSLAPNQSTGQQAIADISGSGLDHLAMTAAVLEQQNMVTTEVSCSSCLLEFSILTIVNII